MCCSLLLLARARRQPVPVPRLLKEGVSEAQAKDLAAKATVHINKGLCE